MNGAKQQHRDALPAEFTLNTLIDLPREGLMYCSGDLKLSHIQSELNLICAHMKMNFWTSAWTISGIQQLQTVVNILTF